MRVVLALKTGDEVRVVHTEESCAVRLPKKVARWSVGPSVPRLMMCVFVPGCTFCASFSTECRCALSKRSPRPCQIISGRGVDEAAGAGADEARLKRARRSVRSAVLRMMGDRDSMLDEAEWNDRVVDVDVEKTRRKRNDVNVGGNDPGA